MPAAQLLGGFAHYAKDTDSCSMCETYDRNDLDPDSFVPRTDAKHRKLAAAWLSADSEEERHALYQKNGVRWSELLRLEYLDLVQNTGMDVDLVDCDGSWEVELPTEEERMTAIHVFRHGSKTDFGNLKAKSLRYLAIQEGLNYRCNRESLFLALSQLRNQRQWPIPPESFGSSVQNPPTLRPTALQNCLPLPDATSTSISQLHSCIGHNPPPIVSDPPLDALGKARLAFRQQKPKLYLSKKFSIDTLLLLAKELGIGPILTPKGRISRDRQQIVNALIKKRDVSDTGLEQLSWANGDLDATSIATTEATRNEDVVEHDGTVSRNEAQALYRTATKAKINRLRRTELVAVWKVAAHFIAAANRARNVTMAKKTAENDWEDEDDEDGVSLGSSDTTGRADEEVFEMPLRNRGLKDEIHRYRKALGDVTEDRHPTKAKEGNPLSRKKAAVLGKDTLAAIREDMLKLEILSWMDAAPNRPGEKSHGSFTADQWRTFCTINLPITLVRLWGPLPQDERKYAILVNFMHLVTAVRLANMRPYLDQRSEQIVRLSLL
ncbi:hypothetical protein C8J55DRAFT_556318 [Lentinula edodes]|uniref:Uncharacterized protein n=1 Tax=Lentinula lateritia TaxID=40482 RepID=A0A9W9AYG9_9AGAR|nr:hypothetical protein C8J55DRAFT_556318 [Lentinula edodes]